MLVVTAANNNKDYPELLEQCVASATRCGYACTVYDLGGLGYGDTKFAGQNLSQLEACYRKPRVILDCLKKMEPNQLLMWADADAYFLERIDEVDTKDYDVGLVWRPVFKPQQILSGVMFLYNTTQTREFIQTWIDTVPLEPPKGRRSLWKHGDQKWLNSMLLSHEFEAKIKHFSYLIYNNYEEDAALRQGAKIIHYKGLGLREIWRKDGCTTHHT